jgi:hypothetical protein
MSQGEDEAKRTWASRSAERIVDGVLSAIERYPADDQVTLLREILRHALRHMPNSSDEIRNLARHFYAENLSQPQPRDDDAPEEPPWA